MHALLVLLAFSIVSAISAPVSEVSNWEDDILDHTYHDVEGWTDGVTDFKDRPKPPKTGQICLGPGILRIIPTMNSPCPGPAKVVPLYGTKIVRRIQTSVVSGGETGLADDAPEAKTQNTLFSVPFILPEGPGPVIIPPYTRPPLLPLPLRPTAVAAPAPLSTPATISTAVAAASSDTIIAPDFQDSVVVTPNTTALLSHVNRLVPAAPTSRTTTPIATDRSIPFIVEPAIPKQIAAAAQTGDTTR